MDVSDDDSDSELLKEPPSQNLVYRRPWKDKLKLIVLPPLYFVFMVVAAVVVFFSVNALIVSYHHKVRSIQDVTVDHYRTIGIALFPEHRARYEGCEFLYADALHPGEGNWSGPQPSDQTCTHTNVTFYSAMQQRNRTAMVFNGPTLVHRKQSLAVHYTVNTESDNFSAIEYLLLGYWDHVLNESSAAQAEYLTKVEKARPLSTVPAGFRTWIKMSYTIHNSGGGQNISDFTTSADLASYNKRNSSDQATAPLLVLFEWKGNTYEYVTDILSTTAWNTVGSLAGVMVALIKVGEYAKQWINRVRRERKKKFLKVAEIEEQHRRKMHQFWQRKVDKRLSQLSSKLAI